MDERKLRDQMIASARRAARLGLIPALPEDKRRRVWREPLNRYELHVVRFIREQGEITAKDLAGAMDETLDDTMRVLQGLIDRDYVKVISRRGYASYTARSIDDLREDTEQS